jgi:hypothetical protein
MRFSAWESETRERLWGLAAWLQQPVNLNRSPRLNQLLDHPDIFDDVALSKRDVQSLHHAELLTEIFDWVGHPIRFEDLVSVVSKLKRVELAPFVAAGEDPEHPFADSLHDSGPLPDQVAEWSEFLGQLWAEIELLPRLQRIAYLLNFTAGDGQLELFLMYGAASIRRIGAVLELTADHFARVWLELRLSDEERRNAEALTTNDERFARLWQYLPLTDATIARVLGTERQKVINLRKAASDRLSRRLAHRDQGQV